MTFEDFALRGFSGPVTALESDETNHEKEFATTATKRKSVPKRRMQQTVIKTRTRDR